MSTLSPDHPVVTLMHFLKRAVLGMKTDYWTASVKQLQDVLIPLMFGWSAILVRFIGTKNVLFTCSISNSLKRKRSISRITFVVVASAEQIIVEMFHSVGGGDKHCG
jgi:hypothetical protein